MFRVLHASATCIHPSKVRMQDGCIHVVYTHPILLHPHMHTYVPNLTHTRYTCTYTCTRARHDPHDMTYGTSHIGTSHFGTQHLTCGTTLLAHVASHICALAREPHTHSVYMYIHTLTHHAWPVRCHMTYSGTLGLTRNTLYVAMYKCTSANVPGFLPFVFLASKLYHAWGHMFVVYARCFASHVLASKFISTRVDTLGVLDLCNNSGPDLYHFCKHVSHFAHLITTLFVVYARCYATFQVRSGTQHDMQKCILDAKSISEMSHFGSCVILHVVYMHFVYMQMEHLHVM